jgi:hypothetical protein
MLHEEYSVPPRVKKSFPLKIPKTFDEKKDKSCLQPISKSYTSSENLFDPSISSPPVSYFMKRLMERHSSYNNVANLSKFTSA